MGKIHNYTYLEVNSSPLSEPGVEAEGRGGGGGRGVIVENFEMTP